MNDPSAARAAARAGVPYYDRSLDFEALWREYPPAAEYREKIHQISRDELRAIQNRRFLQQVARGWDVPFYRRHWSAAGLAPGDIRSLDDLQKLPPYDVHDLRKAIERAPPWGDHMGLDPSADGPMPLVLQTSGGTTGLPRPMLYSPVDREMQDILSARRLWTCGVRPYDVVQVTLSLGLSNGGMLAREAIWKYTGAIPVMTGSGAVTPTRRQIEIMKAWGVNVLFGFPAYLRHMAHVAKDEMGIEPKSLGLKSILTHLGVDDRKTIEDLWGAPAYDCYGTNECGAIAIDCEERQGMHIFEDAFVVEIADPGTMAATPVGERGTVFLTALYKHLAPVIRFNVNDVSSILPGRCACGGTHLRMDRIFGRSDNMVKLRGVNLFPEAIGALVAEEKRSNGEYVCFVEHVGADGREEMTVWIETAADGAAVEAALARRLREALGVKIEVKAVAPGATDPHTGLSQTSKIRRLVDRRKKG